MTNRDERRFHLFDAMVLIAILAAASAAGRAYLVATKSPVATNKATELSLGTWIIALHNGGVPFALVCSVALVLIRLPVLRHQRRRLCTQPGFTAALAVVACFAVVFLFDPVAAILFHRVKWGGWGPWNEMNLALVHISRTLMTAAPCAVAATWTVLALGGRWRPERSWLDRLGLVLGIYWISWPIAAWLVALGA
jgi:hypothetical protein